MDFSTAYDELLARWPAGTEEIDVPTPYGPTRVHACGPVDAAPLVLLPGGGATGLAWYANAPALGERHRVYAVDLLGDAGRSRRQGRVLADTADLMAWLDTLLAGLDLTHTHLCGHSYGGWIAATYALHAPQRIDRLALLDPTQVFAGFRPAYLLRALPMLVRPSAARARAFLARETAGTEPDEATQDLYALGSTLPDRKLVVGRRARIAQLHTPALVLLAEHGRAQDARKVAVRARQTLPQAQVEILPAATHHSLPAVPAAQINERLLKFLS